VIAMMIVGLTGSMAMGKSTAARYLASLGIPVFDSDAAVHELYEHEAVDRIAEAFPGVTAEGRVDRSRLATAIAGSSDALARLESIVHPMVRRKQRDFLLDQADSGAEIAVLDIPLLFESGADELVDAVIVVSAPEHVQRKRLLGRRGMTPEKIDDLLNRQMPDAEKRARADFVVDTSGPVEATQAQLDRIIATLRERDGEKLAAWRAMELDA
jgi:dephospho-CoA kinase